MLTLLGLALLMAGLCWARAPLFSAVGGFLVVDDPVEPAAAIVVLDGGQPLREQEAANLYAQGWAARIVITRGRGEAASRLDILEQLGVPTEAIQVIDQQPNGTLEEMQLLAEAIGSTDTGVVVVTSPYHTRRAGLAWWRATSGSVRGIVRSAWQDPFDAQTWWLNPQARMLVWHEYLGMAASLVGLRDS